jgi:hypothetical protein
MTFDFKKVTYAIAALLTFLVTFAATDAGQALIKQYPKTSLLFTLAAGLLALFHNPKAATAVILLLVAPGLMFAQAPPANLPGYTVQLTAGYSLLTGAQNNNGFFSSVAVPIKTFNNKYSFSLSGRADYFSIATPSSYVIAGGPEARFQFSKPDLMGGIVFQPFGNVMLGMAKSACPAAGCAPTVDTSGKFAFKIGGGLDVPLKGGVVARLFQVDYIKASIYPNGLVLSNFAQVTTGLGIRF